MPRPEGRGALSDDARLTFVCLSRTSGLSREQRPRKTKIGTEGGYITRDSDTTFKVKRSKVNLQGAETYCGGLPHSLLYVSKASRCNHDSRGYNLTILIINSHSIIKGQRVGGSVDSGTTAVAGTGRSASTRMYGDQAVPPLNSRAA